MAERVLNVLRKRLQWRSYQRMLDQMTTMKEFQAFMARTQEPLFKQYQEMDELGRAEIKVVLQELELDVRGKSFLDIGPAYGSVLDHVRECGAASVEFVEYNPVFYTYNRLKAMRGYQIDVRKGLDTLPARRYDIVWIRGTYVADGFILQGNFVERLRYRYPKLEVLLPQIDRLVVPGGTIIFWPHWMSNGEKRNIENYLESSLTARLKEYGYQVMREIEFHNRLYSPITYVRTVPAV